MRITFMPKMEEICCEHEPDPNAESTGDDGDMIARFKAACVWSRCAKCGKRILLVDDTGVFAEDEL